MKQIIFLSLIFIILHTTAAALPGKLGLSGSVFTNGTALPGQGYAGMISKTVHPGIDLGVRYNYHPAKQDGLFQTLKIGGFYHRHAQTGIRLFTETGYRIRITKAIYAEGLIGAGYLHMIPDVEQFKWTSEGYTRKKGIGRAQLMTTASLAAGYTLPVPKDVQFFIQYQFWLQAPFVKKYVPVLPNSAFHIGIHYPLFKGKHDHTQKNGE